MGHVLVIETTCHHISDDLREDLGQASFGHIDVLLRSVEVGRQVDGFFLKDLVVVVSRSEVLVLIHTSKVPGTVLLGGISRARDELGELDGRHDRE